MLSLPSASGHRQRPLTAGLLLWLLLMTGAATAHAAPASQEEVLRRWSGKSKTELRAAAEAGTAEAQLALADTLLKTADATPAQREEAVRWLQRAAEQKLAAAQAALGTIYFEGKHAPQNHAAGWKWMREAATQELVYAQNYLGVAYSNGWGNNANLWEAARWIRAAAAQDFLPAVNNLGWMTIRAQGGIPRDEAAGVKLIQRAADGGHARSQADLGWMLRNGIHLTNDIAAAFNWFKKAADQGFAAGQFHLANAYALGEGVAPDLLAALKLHRLAADQGHADACVALAQLYASGEAAPRNAADSSNALYERAADAGNPRAAERLAERLRWGYGCTPDRLRACGWLCQASGGIGMANLFGLLAHDGRLLPQPDEESRQFAALFQMHRRACWNREPAALLQMGRWCVEGTVAPVDLVEAYKWFTLAHQRGDTTAPTELAKLRGRMTPEQIKDAERRVAKMHR